MATPTTQSHMISICLRWYQYQIANFCCLRLENVFWQSLAIRAKFCKSCLYSLLSMVGAAAVASCLIGNWYVNLKRDFIKWFRRHLLWPWTASKSRLAGVGQFEISLLQLKASPQPDKQFSKLHIICSLISSIWVLPNRIQLV